VLVNEAGDELLRQGYYGHFLYNGEVHEGKHEPIISKTLFDAVLNRRWRYGVFHSPGYRSRYAEFLKIDFPRLPLTGKLELFRALARLDGELTALHLLESPKLAQPITKHLDGRSPAVEKISWSQNTVWLDKAQTTGLEGVHEDV
jgi:Type ISP C-terminal specificity domain